MTDRAADLVSRQEQLFTDSSTWRQHASDIAEITRPIRAELLGELTEGGKRMANVFDSTAINANQRLGATLYGTASNPADAWFKIGTEDPDFNKWPKARSALETYSRRTLASFGPSYCNFYGETFPFYLDLPSLGTAIFYDEKREDRSGFTDKCMPLSECEFEIDAEGWPVEFYRRWATKSVTWAAREYGKENLSDAARAKLATEPNAKIDLLHAVTRNDAYSPGRLAADNKPWSSHTIEVEQKHIIASKGYYEMPFFVVPWERAAGERKGRGCGEMVLADNRSMQVLTKANLTAGQWAASPPWGAASEGVISVVRLAPNKISYGAIGPRGEQLLQPLIRGNNVPFSLEQAQALREAIREGFFASLLQTVGRTGLAPVEVLDIRDERFRAMAPYLGNIHIFLARPLVQRRFRMLAEEGTFKDVVVPRELVGRPLQIEFVSPMALAQKAATANSAIRAAGALGEGAKLDPSIVDRFNGDAFAKKVTEGFGVPDILNDDDVTQQNRDARIRAQSQMANIEAAKGMAQAATHGADALATVRGARQAA